MPSRSGQLPSLHSLLAGFESGEVTAREVAERCLARIKDPQGQGSATFTKVHTERARREADAVDQRRLKGQPVPALAGVPISIKDLFDLAGDVTTAGSVVLRDLPPAAADAPAVARLRAAGCIVVGRTNMTEFAYSGVGLNPHYGTPLSPYDRESGRIPGGSSSGAAIAVSDGMCAASLGTDTAGSVRIPAAFAGLVGFKPTAWRVSRKGAIPLSTTLDSVGPLGRTVDCCALLDATLSGMETRGEPARDPKGLRLIVPTTLVLDNLDQQVATAFERALAALTRAGAKIMHVPIPALARLPQLNSRGGIAAAEAYAWHKELLEKRRSEYDPRVSMRILKGRDLTTADYQDLLRERTEITQRVGLLTATFDAVALPTVAIVAPRIAQFDSDEQYVALNALVLRNTAIANFLDRCAISLPVHRDGEAPVGLMLVGEHGADRRLLALALGAERVASPASTHQRT